MHEIYKLTKAGERVRYLGDVCVVDLKGACAYHISGVDVMEYADALNYLRLECGWSTSEAHDYLRELGLACVCRSDEWGGADVLGWVFRIPADVLYSTDEDANNVYLEHTVYLKDTGGTGEQDDEFPPIKILV